MRDTIEMAREAGFKEHNGMVYVTTIDDNCAEELKRFAELVRADEREECAKVCEQYKGYGGNLFAPAIRNRGNT
jgi:sugar phosphate isomerase/epimerase